MLIDKLLLKHQQTVAGLVYADVGQSLAQNHKLHRQPCPPCLDDTPTEYAQLNHSLHSNKCTSAQSGKNGMYSVALCCTVIYRTVVHLSSVIGGGYLHVILYNTTFCIWAFGLRSG